MKSEQNQIGIKLYEDRTKQDRIDVKVENRTDGYNSGGSSGFESAPRKLERVSTIE